MSPTPGMLTCLQQSCGWGMESRARRSMCLLPKHRPCMESVCCGIQVFRIYFKITLKQSFFPLVGIKLLAQSFSPFSLENFPVTPVSVAACSSPPMKGLLKGFKFYSLCENLLLLPLSPSAHPSPN